MKILIAFVLAFLCYGCSEKKVEEKEDITESITPEVDSLIVLIQTDSLKLKAIGLSHAEVLDAVLVDNTMTISNANGSLKQRVKVKHTIKNMEELSHIIIRAKNKNVVMLQDIAIIRTEHYTGNSKNPPIKLVFTEK